MFALHSFWVGVRLFFFFDVESKIIFHRQCLLVLQYAVTAMMLAWRRGIMPRMYKAHSRSHGQDIGLGEKKRWDLPGWNQHQNCQCFSSRPTVGLDQLFFFIIFLYPLVITHGWKLHPRMSFPWFSRPMKHVHLVQEFPSQPFDIWLERIIIVFPIIYIYTFSTFSSKMPIISHYTTIVGS